MTNITIVTLNYARDNVNSWTVLVDNGKAYITSGSLYVLFPLQRWNNILFNRIIQC